MGLFGLGTKGVIETPQSALMLACLTMLYTDDGVEDDKLVLLEMLDKTGKGLLKSPEYKNVKKFFDKHSFSECIETVAGSLHELDRETVFLNLLDFSLADGDVNDNEGALLDAYATAFELDEDFFKAAMRLMMMKNRSLV